MKEGRSTAQQRKLTADSHTDARTTRPEGLGGGEPCGAPERRLWSQLSPRNRRLCGPHNSKPGKALIRPPALFSPAGFLPAKPRERLEGRGPLAAATRAEGRGRGGVCGGREQPARGQAPARPPAAVGLRRNVGRRAKEAITRSCKTHRPRIERSGHSDIIQLSVLPNLGYKLNVILIKMPMDILLWSRCRRQSSCGKRSRQE